MNEYIFDITQVLQKEIKIKSKTKYEAEKIINEMFENGEIILNQDNCIQASIKLIESNENDQPSLFD